MRGRLVQSGPVSDGYMPVQYDLVVVMSGSGKAKWIVMSLYTISLVTNGPTLDGQLGPSGAPLQLYGTDVLPQISDRLHDALALAELVIDVAVGVAPALVGVAGGANDHTLEGDGLALEPDGSTGDMVQTLLLELDSTLELDDVREEVVLTNGGEGATEPIEVVTVIVVDSVAALEGGCIDRVGVADADDGLDIGGAVDGAVMVVIVHVELLGASEEGEVPGRLEPVLADVERSGLVRVTDTELVNVRVAVVAPLGDGPDEPAMLEAGRLFWLERADGVVLDDVDNGTEGIPVLDNPGGEGELGNKFDVVGSEVDGRV